jgi:hypothetical protein
MRKDHQLQQACGSPSGSQGHAKNKYSVENTGFNFAGSEAPSRLVASTPTSCQMKRPLIGLPSGLSRIRPGATVRPAPAYCSPADRAWMPSFFLISLLNGLSVGLLLFMLASGLTLIFSMMGVLNFAHASFYMVGAYVAYTITQAWWASGGGWCWRRPSWA